MKANEFVKEFGWELAQRDAAAFLGGFIKRDDFVNHYGFDILDDLKTLVDAWELVESLGGLSIAKDELYKCDVWTVVSLKQAIQLVESCQ